MKRKKLNRIIGRSLLGLLVLGAGLLLIGAARSKEDKSCTALDIQIGATQQKGFINEKEVKGLIAANVGNKLEGLPVKQFNLRAIESSMEKNVWIKKAQMFFDNNEVLHVQVEQRIPVARLVEATGASYYLDSAGFRLPLSNTDRADVPVFTNVPAKKNNPLLKSIIAMATYINTDSFWLAQAGQIDVLPTGSFELYPVVGNHIVDLGDGKNAGDKLERVKNFYQNISSKKGFDVYSRISVAYDKQVVAVRRDSSAPAVDASKAVRVFEQIVKNNRTKANEEDGSKEQKKQEQIKPATPTVNKEVKTVKDKPPEVKNKGNPSDKKTSDKKKKQLSLKPKAVMPKTHHN